MATSRAYMEFILDQLPEGCRARSMMGEYLVYYRDKVAANLCDDRLLVKPVPAALELLDPPSGRCLMRAPERCCWWKMWRTGNFSPG